PTVEDRKETRRKEPPMTTSVTAVTVRKGDADEITIRTGDTDAYPGWAAPLEIVRILEVPARDGGTKFVFRVRDEPDGEIFNLSLHDITG
nr:hypothetical protein [Micromonospora sp. DSM 115978]